MLQSKGLNVVLPTLWQWPLYVMDNVYTILRTDLSIIL